MPRTAGIAPGGMIFHCLNRGNDRRQVFDDDADFAAFERVLQATLDGRKTGRTSFLTGAKMSLSSCHVSLCSRSTDGYTYWPIYSGPVITSYQDTGLPSNTAYYYVVTNGNGNGTSGGSFAGATTGNPANAITAISINDGNSGSGVQATENGATTFSVTVSGTLYQQESVSLSDNAGLFSSFTQTGDSWSGGPASSETLTYQANAGASPGAETITAADSANPSVWTTDPGIVAIPPNIVTGISINGGAGVQATENSAATLTVTVTGTLYQQESVNLSDNAGLFSFTQIGDSWSGGPASSETLTYQASAGATAGNETITAVDASNTSISATDAGIVSTPANVVTSIAINDNTGGSGVQVPENGAAAFSVTVTGTLYQSESVSVLDSAGLFAFTPTGNNWSGGPTSSEIFYYQANPGQSPGTETITAADGSLSTTDPGIVTIPANVVTSIVINDNTGGSGVQAPENGAATLTVTVTGTLYQQESVDLADNLGFFSFTQIGDSWTGGPASSETLTYQASAGPTSGTEILTATDGTNSSISTTDAGIVTIPANVVTGITINDGNGGSGVQAPENGVAAFSVTVTGTLYQPESVGVGDSVSLFGFTQMGNNWIGGPTGSETFFYQANAGQTPGTETITAVDGTNSSISTTDPGIVTIPSNVITGISISDNTGGSGVQAPENGAAAFTVTVTGTLYQQESVNVGDSLGLFGFTQTGNNWTGGPTGSETFYYTANAGQTLGTETITAVDGSNSSVSTTANGIVTGNVVTGISIATTNPTGDVQAPVGGVTTFTVTITGSLYQAQAVNVTESAGLFGGSIALIGDSASSWSSTGGPYSTEVLTYHATAGGTPGTESIYATTTDPTGATYPASITADVVQVQSITVADGAGTGPTVPVTGMSSNTVYYTRNADGTASVTLTSVVVPPSTAGYAATQYRLFDPSDTTDPVQSGQLAANMNINVPAPPGGAADAFELQTGTYIDNTFIATQSINLAAHVVTLGYVTAGSPGTAPGNGSVPIAAGGSGTVAITATEDGQPANPSILQFQVINAATKGRVAGFTVTPVGTNAAGTFNITIGVAGAVLADYYEIVVTSPDDANAVLWIYVQVP